MKEVFGAVLSVKDNVSGVMKQAKESTRGYRGEVEKTKKELEKLDKKKIREKELKIKNSEAYKAIEGDKKKLQPLAKKTIEIQAKTEHAVDKVKKVKSQLDKIKSTKVVQLVVKGGQKAMKAMGKGMLTGTAAALGAFTIAAGAAGTQAASFQSQMQNVGTLLDGDVQGKLQGMSKQLKQVSIDTGAATSDLTDGLYQVVSAFGESAESVKQLEIAAKAAKAGNATTTDSVNMLSAVTKGYGDTSAAALQKASDLAFLTVKLGQTSFPELASSMGQVVPAGGDHEGQPGRAVWRDGDADRRYRRHRRSDDTAAGDDAGIFKPILPDGKSPQKDGLYIGGSSAGKRRAGRDPDEAERIRQRGRGCLCKPVFQH